MTDKICSNCGGKREFDDECGWFCPNQDCGELGS